MIHGKIIISQSLFQHIWYIHSFIHIYYQYWIITCSKRVRKKCPLLFISQTCYQQQTISLAFHLFLPALSMATSPLLVSRNTLVIWGITSLGVFINIFFSQRNYFISFLKTFIMNAYFINSVNLFSVFNSRGICVIFWCFMFYGLLW